MSFSKIVAIAAVISSASLVAAHGYVQGIVVDGTYYGGYIVTQYPYTTDPPAVIAWSTEAKDLGYVDGTSYASDDIICHKSAQPGALTAEVPAGGKVELQWTEWPESHKGPVLDYLASCNGNCSSVDKTALEFFKIDQGGLVNDSNVPGTWASDQLIANNNSWTVTIPTTVAPGNYVLRHEIIALHSAGSKDGAQNYPQCINLKVTGAGTDSPAGTLGTSLYTDTDPGILVNIYQTLSSYDIPGPTLYTGGSSSSGSTGSGTAQTITSTVVDTTTTSTSFSLTSPSAVQVAVPSSETSTGSAARTASSISVPTPAPVATQTPTSPVSSAVTQTAGAVPSTPSSAAAASATPSIPTGSALTEYLNSMSADDVLSLMRGTMSWLLTTKKHARDLSQHGK